MIDGLHKGGLAGIKQIEADQPADPGSRGKLQIWRIAINSAGLVIRHHAGIAYRIGQAIKESPGLVLSLQTQQARHESKQAQQPDKRQGSACNQKPIRQRCFQQPGGGGDASRHKDGQYKGQRDMATSRRRSHFGPFASFRRTVFRHAIPIPESF